MKVLLIQPPVQDFYDTDVRLQPIGLCYLKAAVKKHLPDVDVIIKDYHGGCGRRTVAIPKELRYLTDYYPVADKSPFSTFHQYYHFGKPFDEIEAEIAEIRPDVVGISSLFTPYYREVLEVAARVKKRLNVPVVVGGSHASAVPESLALITECRLRHPRRRRESLCGIFAISEGSKTDRRGAEPRLQERMPSLSLIPLGTTFRSTSCPFPTSATYRRQPTR